MIQGQLDELAGLEREAVRLVKKEGKRVLSDLPPLAQLHDVSAGVRGALHHFLHSIPPFSALRLA